MPQYCSVPGCRNSGGHKFPEERELQLKWRVVIKRRDTTTKGLWKPGKHDVVCAAHFKDADYRVSGLLGKVLHLDHQNTVDLDDVDSSVVNNVQLEVEVVQICNYRVILDATETPIQKPSHVDAQSVTWSSYKHKNTIKTMIGCTPRGTVSYKDSIMADRGIMVQDLLAAQDVKVNTPTMLKGKSQLEPEEVVRDRRVASKGFT
ncbi:unnamed protein product [Mytilus coruscus]|uniref:THAP-type domain-containing protein n=1 Tax=Mytilus coruscus TaxID=42192 RepID=A0A6J8D1C3_MYTCO|nr:unnamed protein product [Mytilus coruscus]